MRRGRDHGFQRAGRLSQSGNVVVANRRIHSAMLEVILRRCLEALSEAPPSARRPCTCTHRELLTKQIRGFRPIDLDRRLVVPLDDAVSLPLRSTRPPWRLAFISLEIVESLGARLFRRATLLARSIVLGLEPLLDLRQVGAYQLARRHMSSSRKESASVAPSRMLGPDVRARINR